MPLVKQSGFKFSILCDVFLLKIFILLPILINIVISVPTETQTTATATTTIPVTTTTTTVTSNITKSMITIEKLNLNIQLNQQNNINNNTNSNNTTTHLNNIENINNNSSSSTQNNNNNNNNTNNNNYDINNNNNNNKNDDDNKNNKNNNNKELPIQYAELETLKTLSKRFDVYSDFSKIPFDTIHRILRDEEPEYRNDDQRIKRRWKKSILINSFNLKNLNNHHRHDQHVIEKRSSNIQNEHQLNSNEIQSINSYKSSLSSLNNINDYINSNNNNNNYNLNKSSDNSTKIILNLQSKNFNNYNETIKHILLLKTVNNLTNIEYINLKNNNLSDFPLLNDELINLKYLDLSNNKLKQFHLMNTFELEALNLNGNQVSNFTLLLSQPTTILAPSSSLSSSILQNKNYKLKELYLNKNNLTSIQYINITKLNNLEIFDLSCNEIHLIDKNYFIGHENNLKLLNLCGNKLNIIHKEQFNNLLIINTIILSNNNVTKIDLDTFSHLLNLQYLDLSYNNIDGNSIHSLQGIPDLIGLSIAYNPNLGDSLQEFVASWSLKELDISGTGLCQIPAALAQSVRSLKLSNNWFEIIRCGDLDSYPLLQYLDLSYSHIDDIEDDALGRLEILETLFLDHNNLYRIPISLPISLENLFLHNNQIMDIQPQIFQTLINLKVLDLSENKIMYLPGLPLPKLITLNIQSCELRGLSQSVVKTSPKLRDLLLDGNPIKCTDLLGIAEWASPCQNDRITELKDIKTNFQNMHKYLNHFKQEGKLCKDECCGNYKKMKELKKPTCANRNRNNKKRLNRIESQLQKYDTDNIDNDNDDDDNLKRKLNLMRITFQINKQTNKQENEQIQQQISNNFSTVQQTENVNENNNQEKLYDNQSRSLFMANPTIGKDTITSIPPLIISKNTAVSNEHEINIKTSEKLFSGTSTNEQVYKSINNNTNANKNILFDAKIPILSLLHNSTESFISDVSHNATTVFKKKTLENIERQQQQQQEQQNTQNKVISNIKSDNNYVETSVLFESIKNQKIKQNESHFESKNGQQEISTKKLKAQKIFEGKKPSNNIETLPTQNNDEEGIVEHFQERATTENNNSNINLRTIDEGHIDMSATIKSSQINEGKFPTTTQMAAIEIKTSSLTLSHNDQEIPINDQSLLDNANSEYRPSTHKITSSFTTSQSNSKTFKNTQIQKTKHKQKEQRKINFPDTESNFQENNFQNYKRKTLNDNINTKQPTTSSPIEDDTTTVFGSAEMTTITTKINTYTPMTTIVSKASTPKTTLIEIPSNTNKADKVVFLDQPLLIKENYTVNRNQNISQSLDQDYHRIETVKQETTSTYSNYQSQKRQLQQQHKQQKITQQQDKKIPDGNKKQRQQESQSTPEGLIQKQLNVDMVPNNDSKSLFQRKRYNLNGNQQEKLNKQTVPTMGGFDGNIQIGLDKQNYSTNFEMNENKTIQNIIFSTLNDSKMVQVNPVSPKVNTTKLKRPKNKQTRKLEIKNQKVQAINLENSPLTKDENKDFKLNLNFHQKNTLQNSVQSPESNIKIGTLNSKQIHRNLNTPKEASATNPDIFDLYKTMTSENHKSNVNHTKMLTDISDIDKLTTRSLVHHTVNTAIVPYTEDDYAFERSGNKDEFSDNMQDKHFPSPIELVKLQPSNFNILSSYSNDEPSFEETPLSNFNTNDIKMKYTVTTEQNHVVFSNDETSISQHALIQDKKNTLETLNENFTTNIKNKNVNNNATMENVDSFIPHSISNKSNSLGGGSGNNGLPPEQWLDIRKATSHPGLFIVIGVTFGLLLTLGLIHIYRCRKPWYYCYNQKGSHHHHHHHHQHNLSHHHRHHPYHQSNRNHNNCHYNDTDRHNRNHNLTTTMSDDYCQCNEEDYYIEADYESQSSNRRDFLPMELLSLNGNVNDTSNSNNNSGNSNQAHKITITNGHNLDIW